MNRGAGRLARVARLVAGIAFVVGGVILMVLPGPGLPLLIAGLLLLGNEFSWARRIRARLLAVLRRGRRRLARVRGDAEVTRPSEARSAKRAAHSTDEARVNTDERNESNGGRSDATGRRLD